MAVMTEELKAQILAKMKRGIMSLVDFRTEFCERSVDEVDPAKFHYQWSHDLLFSDESFAIEGFRESAKSTYVLDVYPKYCIFYPDPYRNYIVILKNNATTAQKKLKELERSIKANRWLRERIVEIVEESGEAYEIIIQAPGQPNDKLRFRIETYGKGSSIRGLNWNNQRPSIVIADDLQDEDDARSQTTLDTDWTWFRSDVGFLGRNTRFFMIANNLGERCIVEQIAADPKAFGYKFYRVPILDGEGAPQWPAMFTKQQVESERQRYIATGDIATWMRNRMCVAVSPETQIFHKDDLRWYLPQEKKNIIARCSIYAAYDPTGTGTSKSDLCAIPIIGVDEEDYWYLLDVRYGRWSPNKQEDELFQVIREYKPYRTGIELVGAHGGLLRSTINKSMTERRCMFTPNWLKPSNKLRKEERIILALSQRVKLGKLVLPEKASWLDEVLTEFLMFTKDGAKSKYDDIIDAIAMFHEFAKPPIGKDGSSLINKRVKDLPRNSIQNNIFR